MIVYDSLVTAVHVTMMCIPSQRRTIEWRSGFFSKQAAEAPQLNSSRISLTARVHARARPLLVLLAAVLVAQLIQPYYDSMSMTDRRT